MRDRTLHTPDPDQAFGDGFGPADPPALWDDYNAEVDPDRDVQISDQWFNIQDVTGDVGDNSVVIPHVEGGALEFTTVRIQ